MSIFNSPLFKIGVGAMTGGAGGAAMGAASSMNNPAGRAFGAYQTGSNIYNSWKPPEQTFQASSQSPFGGADMSDRFGAMGRRMQSYYGGGG